MTADEESQAPGARRRTLWMPVGTAAMLVLLALYGFWIKTPAAWAAVGLLSLSNVVDLFDHGRKARLARDLAFCEAVKIVLLILYALIEKKRIESKALEYGLSAFSLLFAVVLTLAMIFISADVIRHARAGRLTDLFRELLHEKVPALSGVLIAFLHVTYGVAFALAFSDHSVVQLYATNDGGTHGSDSAQDDYPYEDRVAKFFFAESAASIQCTEAFAAAAERDPRLRLTIDKAGLKTRVAAFQDVKAAACDPPGLEHAHERLAAAWNVRQLYELRAILRRLRCHKQGCTHLIEVRGHANDTALKSNPIQPYVSNYEISKQRADQITLLLSQAFQRETNAEAAPDVRWLSYGVSNEESFLDPDQDWADAEPLSRKLSVEVKIARVADSFTNRHLRAAHSERRTLDLLDYLYFTVYTITTTGYGDIKPVSAYSKFVVSLANLIELIFVVGVFNVIASTRPESGNAESRLPPGD